MLSNDVELHGANYNVVPGTYERGRRKPLAVSKPGTRKTGRAEFGPFSQGLLQATGNDGERGWGGITVGPVFDGAGVEPFPNVAATAGPAILDVPLQTQRAYGVIANGAAYVGLGRRIYKSVALTNGTWADWTVAADLGVGFTISGMVYSKDDVFILLSTGQDIRRLNTTTNAVTVWRTGEKAVLGCAYAGELIYASLLANATDVLRLSGTKWNGNAVTHFRALDAPIVRMANFNGKVAIATRKSLYFMGGQPYAGEADDASVTADTSKAPAWIGDPEPVMTHGQYAEGDDFVFLESYRGRLYTWLGGRVAEFDPSGEGNWLRSGPEGVNCYGAAVAGDWLVVAIASRYGGTFDLWGFDGQGWWLLHQRPAASATRILWPCPLAGAGNRDLIAFWEGGGSYDLIRLVWRSTTVNTYAAAGTWTSPLIDGDDAAKDKRWTRGGAVFAAPDYRGNAASVDGVIFPIEYSIDGGVTWTAAVSQSAVSGATRVFTRDFTFNNPPQSRLLQLRCRWSSVLDWAPVLTSLWMEYEDAEAYALAEVAEATYDQGLLDENRRRRRWELTISASDRNPRRDGQLSALTGRQTIQALWAAWATGAPVTFKDIDNDTDPVTYTVEIVDIEEKAAKPSDAARWGESVVTLTLEEVAAGSYPFVAGVYGVGTLLLDAAGAITLPTVPSVATAIEARIDTEDGGPTDNLVSIVITGTILTGTLLILRTVASARDVTVTDSGAGAVGNLRLTGEVNYALGTTTNGILLELTALNVWTERARW
jgi:hypothetical protein